MESDKTNNVKANNEQQSVKSRIEYLQQEKKLN
jgi:hypothetical protein